MATAQTTPTQQLREFEQQTKKPYLILGLPFASKKVVIDFLIINLLIVVVPIIVVWLSNLYFSDLQGLSSFEKVAYTAGPVVIYMNLAIGVYVYKVIKDPQNYKKDPPLVIKMKPKREKVQ